MGMLLPKQGCKLLDFWMQTPKPKVDTLSSIFSEQSSPALWPNTQSWLETVKTKTPRSTKQRTLMPTPSCPKKKWLPPSCTFRLGIGRHHRRRTCRMREYAGAGIDAEKRLVGQQSVATRKRSLVSDAHTKSRLPTGGNTTHKRLNFTLSGAGKWLFFQLNNCLLSFVTKKVQFTSQFSFFLKVVQV